MTLLSTTIILFLIMDPIGNITSFRNLLKEIPPEKQRWIIFREMILALIVMVLFYYIGDALLSLLQVSETTARIASGVILFLVAVKILFTSKTSLRANLFNDGEPFLVPLAIPLIAGPGLLATIMLYSHVKSLHSVMLIAILFAWLGASLILILSAPLQRLLGNNGLMACERLMAMILVLLGIQRFLEGIRLFVDAH